MQMLRRSQIIDIIMRILRWCRLGCDIQPRTYADFTIQMFGQSADTDHFYIVIWTNKYCLNHEIQTGIARIEISSLICLKNWTEPWFYIWGCEAYSLSVPGQLTTTWFTNCSQRTMSVVQLIGGGYLAQILMLSVSSSPPKQAVVMQWSHYPSVECAPQCAPSQLAAYCVTLWLP